MIDDNVVVKEHIQTLGGEHMATLETGASVPVAMRTQSLHSESPSEHDRPTGRAVEPIKVPQPKSIDSDRGL